MHKIINIALIMLMLLSSSFNVFADDDYDSPIIQPENNRCIITSGYNSIKKEDYDTAWLPLRSVLEGVGATVTWDSIDRKIGITYNGTDYVANLDAAYMDGYIDICKIKYEDYSIMDLYLQLSPWGGGGEYKIIDDSTYVDDCATMRLLYYFGYYINIDKDNQTFEILPVNEATDKVYMDSYEEYCTLQPVDNEVECLTLDVWCCNEYSYQYGIFDIISCSSKRLDNDDLIVTFEFTYNDKEIEEQLYNKELWEEINDDNLLTQFNGEAIYKRVRDEDVMYDYYVIKCNDHYIGYSVVPNLFLK